MYEGCGQYNRLVPDAIFRGHISMLPIFVLSSTKHTVYQYASLKHEQYWLDLGHIFMLPLNFDLICAWSIRIY